MLKWSFVFLTIAAQAFARGGGEAHHAEGIPTVVFWQAANLAIIFAAIVYFMGEKIKASFAKTRQDFLAASEKSKSIQEAAEKKLKDIQDRLDKLERTSSESIARARAEAVDMRNQIAADAKAAAEKIQQEARATAQAEIMKAQRTLHENVVAESIKMAREVLKKDVGQNDQQRLQDQFGQQIEGVRL